MERVSSRTWVLIGFAGLGVFMSYWIRFSQKQTAWGPAAGSFSYEMPRPQNYEPGFDISDREVVRRYKTLPPLAPKADAAKTAAKKTDPKKTHANKLAAKKAAAAAAAKAKKSKVTVKQVDTSRAMTAAPMTEHEFENVYPAAGAGSYAEPAAASAPADTNTAQKEEEEDLNLSVAQWRSLLQTSPTGQNIAKFIKAKQAGKVDSASYYQIVHELLVDTGPDRRKAALAILDSDVSASTFAFMATEGAQVPADAQAQLKTRLDSYAQPARLSYLAVVLNSSQKDAVLSAAVERVATALAQYKNAVQNVSGQSTTESSYTGRLGGGSGSTVTTKSAAGFTAQHFLSLAPSLKKVSTGGTAAASHAAQLLTEIQNLSKS